MSPEEALEKAREIAPLIETGLSPVIDNADAHEKIEQLTNEILRQCGFGILADYLEKIQNHFWYE